MLYNEVSTCKHCDTGGRLVIDWPMKSTYTMTCNACAYQYVICEDGVVYRSTVKCPTCSAYYMKVN